MSERVVVAGVGMIPFTKPGASEPYPVMASTAARQALADAGIDYAAIQQAYVGYVYGDSTQRPEGAVRGRHDRHPDRQRQQQLLDRLDRAVPRAPGDRERRGRLRARARLRADEARARSAPCSTTGRARSSDFDRDSRSAGRHARAAARAALLRRRRPRAHAASTARRSRRSRKIRAKASRHAANNPLALLRKELIGRRRDGRAGALARRADAADGLPADLRRGGGGARARRRSRGSTACARDVRIAPRR